MYILGNADGKTDQRVMNRLNHAPDPKNVIFQKF
jgi:hypothetical protein